MSLDGIKFAKPPRWKARGILPRDFDVLKPDPRVAYWTPFRSFIAHGRMASIYAGARVKNCVRRTEHRRMMRARRLRRGW